MILYELETGEVPFDGLDLKEIRTKLVEERLRPQIFENTDSALATLIRRCWQDKSSSRPSFEKILTYLRRVKFSD